MFEQPYIRKFLINQPIIVIDAGHGGEDGGAVSESGVLEKDINLSIANNSADLLKMSYRFWWKNWGIWGCGSHCSLPRNLEKCWADWKNQGECED